jgi:DnaJ-class molecular chaperone
MKCPTCHGVGKIRDPGEGNTQLPMIDCPTCDGSGQVPDATNVNANVLKTYIGTKDGRVFLTSAVGVDEAYLNIGKLMTGITQDDAGNVDLDFLSEVPPVYLHQAKVKWVIELKGI